MTGPMPWDDEALMRGVDGELSAGDAARLEADCAADPALAARRDAMLRTMRLAREAFPAVVDPRDADLARMIAGAGAIRASMGWSERLRLLLEPRRIAGWGAVVAACFVAGVMVGDLRGGGAAETGFVLSSDGVIADVGLTQVLDRRLAGEGVDAQGRSVGLTFRDADGRWCRTFTDGAARVAGLACRDSEPSAEGWSLEALAAAKGAGGEVRMAASDTPAPVLAAVDALIAGETLAAVDEASARDAGWQ